MKGRIKRRTFKLDGEKVLLKSYMRTSMGNHAGWYVWINDEKFYCNLLTRREAEDHCYAKWIEKSGKKSIIEKIKIRVTEENYKETLKRVNAAWGEYRQIKKANLILPSKIEGIIDLALNELAEQWGL